MRDFPETTRKERIAHNEVVLRDANDRLRAWPENRTRENWGRPLALLCECPAPECTRELRVAAADYDNVRRDPRRFVVAPGHDDPEYERVIVDGNDYTVVVKDDDVRDIVERDGRQAPRQE